MGEYDDLYAKYGVKPAAKSADDDPYADLKAKYGVAPAKPAPVDMGPEARRARAGMAPSAKHQTAEEAGTSPGPITTRMSPLGVEREGKMIATLPGALVTTEQEPAPADAPSAARARYNVLPGGVELARPEEGGPPDEAYQEGLDPKRPNRLPSELRPEFQAANKGKFYQMDQFERDPIAQMAIAGRMGKLAGETVAPAAAKLGATGARIAVPAVEGAVANKALGGDATTGAAIGAALPLAGLAARKAVNVVAKGAPERVARKTYKALSENAKGKTARQLEQSAGAEGEDLAAAIEHEPELRRVLAIHAPDKPKVALAAVQETKAAGNASRNADFEAMQAYHADKPASSQASIPGILDDYAKLIDERPGAVDRVAVLNRARNEVKALGDRLRERQGLPPANGDYSGTIISPKDLRDLEQSIGTQAFEQGAPRTLRQKVAADLYRPLAKQVNALAEATPGVDAKKFAQTGETIHVLIPVEESLKESVARQASGRAGFRELAKKHATTIAAAALGGGGAAALGNPYVIAATAAGLAAAKVAGKVARRVDFRLAEAQRARVARGLPALEPVTPPPGLEPILVGAVGSRDEDRGMADLYGGP